MSIFSRLSKFLLKLGEPFMPNKPDNILTTLIQHLAYRNAKIVNGDVGIEIEVEGRNLPMIQDKNWTCHADGSLRNGVEYIFNGPKSFEKAEGILQDLEKLLKTPPSRVDESFRTSVHVHMNVNNLWIQELYTLMCVYFLFERPLLQYSGKDRVGNMYCLPASNAEYLPLMLIRNLAKGLYLQNIANDNLRYSAMNIKAVIDQGSLEFRSFRGTIESKEIMEWVKILRNLFAIGNRYNDPVALIADVGRDYEGFVKKAWAHDPMFRDFIFQQPDWLSYFNIGYMYAFDIAHAQPKWADLSKLDRVAELKEAKEAGKKNQIDDDFGWEQPAKPRQRAAPLGLNAFQPVNFANMFNNGPVDPQEQPQPGELRADGGVMWNVLPGDIQPQHPQPEDAQDRGWINRELNRIREQNYRLDHQINPPVPVAPPEEPLIHMDRNGMRMVWNRIKGIWEPDV